MLTRRELFQRSFALSAAAVGGGALAACAGSETRPGKLLGAAQMRTLEAVAAAMLPRGGAFPLGAEDVGVAAKVEALVEADHEDVAKEFQGALYVVEWLPVLRFGARFSKLDAADRLHVLNDLQASRVGVLRQVAQGLARAVNFVFYNEDAVWQHIGYDGPLVAGGPR